MRANVNHIHGSGLNYGYTAPLIVEGNRRRSCTLPYATDGPRLSRHHAGHRRLRESLEAAGRVHLARGTLLGGRFRPQGRYAEHRVERARIPRPVPFLILSDPLAHRPVESSSAGRLLPTLYGMTLMIHGPAGYPGPVLRLGACPQPAAPGCYARIRTIQHTGAVSWCDSSHRP